MTVNDPLIKDLKVSTRKFLEEVKSNPIDDHSSDLVVFCMTVEKILYDGLQYVTNAFGFIKCPYIFEWMETIAESRKNIDAPYAFVNAIEDVNLEPAVSTKTGQLRLLIRQCLAKKCLHYPIQHIIESGKNQELYKENSIIGHSILSQLFLSVLFQCSQINFKLNLRNCSFLDTTWLLPDIIRMELVPTKMLGISVSYSYDRAVIVRIQPGSVVGDEANISVGDIVVNLNRFHVCSATKGRLSAIMSNNKGKPIEITIAKARYLDSNAIYSPIVKLLHEIGLDINKIQLNDRQKILRKHRNGAFAVDYLGGIDVGNRGDALQLDKAANIYETNTIIHNRKPVFIEVGELGVKCLDAQNKEILFEHSFMKISSCGSISNRPKYFGYLAGNEHCNAASQFTCHIFAVNKSDLANTILQSIGQGFHRTIYAV